MSNDVKTKPLDLLNCAAGKGELRLPILGILGRRSLHNRYRSYSGIYLISKSSGFCLGMFKYYRGEITYPADFRDGT